MAKYKKKYADLIIKWFKNAPLYNWEEKEIFVKKSNSVEVVREKVSAPCPSFVRFVDEHNIKVEDLDAWSKKYSDFGQAYKKAKMYQAEWLMNAAGSGFYNSTMSIMALKTNHGWVEKQDNKNKFGEELRQVLVHFVKDSNSAQKGEGVEESYGKNIGDVCSIDD